MTWEKLVESLEPFAEKPVGSVRIDTADIRLIMEQDRLRKASMSVLEDCREFFVQDCDLGEDDYPVARTISMIERLTDA